MNNSITSIVNLARPEILALHAYRSARSETYRDAQIWLDANENPWGCDSTPPYNRYPEPQPQLLCQRLAKHYEVSSSQLLMTRGSDEGIDLLLRTFCAAGTDSILICPPTYGMYKVAATIQGARTVEVPLIKACNFNLDIQAILKRLSKTVKLIFLCSPNNPTGNNLQHNDILSLCEKTQHNSLVVIDEAYIEFSSRKSFIDYLKVYPNLVILRTLSKAHGLAGIRLGVTIAHALIIDLLKKVIAPYPIAQPIIDVAHMQLQPTFMNVTQHQIKIITVQRNILFKFLQNLNFVKKVWQSETNFLLIEVDDVARVMATCQKYGIVLRDRSNEYNLENCIRISIGTLNETKLLMEALKNV